MRTRYKYFQGKWVDEREIPIQETPQTHHVISDTLNCQLWHPATGEYFDSKSAFRKATKATGCVELGNDSSYKKKEKPPGLKEELHRVYDRIRAGYRD